MEKQRFYFFCMFTITLLSWSIGAFAITVSPSKNMEQALVDNINAHLSVFPAPPECNISQHYRQKLETALQKAPTPGNHSRLRRTTEQRPDRGERGYRSLTTGKQGAVCREKNEKSMNLRFVSKDFDTNGWGPC